MLVPGEGPTQDLENATINTEAKYPINSTQSGKRFVLSLHYNRINSFLFVNAAEIYQFKAKDSEIKPYILCLGNISKYFTIDNMKKSPDFIGSIKVFPADYNPIDNSNILDIHRYLVKKT